MVLLLLSGCIASRKCQESGLKWSARSGPPQAVGHRRGPIPPRELLYTFAGKQGTTPIWTLAGRHGFFFTAGMTINADGAPNAYHPDGARGLDFLANAGNSGNWWSLVTDNGRPTGDPLIQTDGQFKGYYISQTSLCDGTKLDADITKYVDARNVPFLALPPHLIGPGMARLGDLGIVYNTRNHRLEYAIVADQGPRDAIGEGSIALATSLGISTDMRNHNAGQDAGVVYVIFPGTAAQPAWPRTVNDVRARAAAAFEDWGGIDQLRGLVAR